MALKEIDKNMDGRLALLTSIEDKGLVCLVQNSTGYLYGQGPPGIYFGIITFLVIY